MNYAKDAGLKGFLKNALREDIGEKDITSEIFIPAGKSIRGVFLAKEDCVVCGLGVVAQLLKIQDKNIKFKPLAREGERVRKGKAIAKVSGRAKSILTVERVALNLLTHLCAVSTKTNEFVNKIKPYKLRILDTRKTTPGLRLLEKYAVRIGGGYNHRMKLDEMILIKDNHLKVIGDRLWVIGFKEIDKKISPKVQIEIEVKTLKEFRKALKLKPDVIMLDNMSLKDIRKAVQIRNNLSPINYHLSPKLEVSGGISLKNVKKVASCGVEMVSIGELTHSVKSVDISLEII